MSEYTRTKLWVPVSIVEAANRVAALFDPDTGGGETFGVVELSPTGEPPATHYMCNTLIKTQYLPILKDAEQALPALQYLAQQYQREQPDPADVEVFCSGVEYGEPKGFKRVEADKP